MSLCCSLRMRSCTVGDLSYQRQGGGEKKDSESVAGVGRKEGGRVSSCHHVYTAKFLTMFSKTILTSVFFCSFQSMV